MAWRDRLRRRAATAVPEAAGAAPTAAPEAARGTAAVRDGAVRDGAVPGDWDGGWRMTAPPALTVSRAAIGVSDGLAFRAGLAAWRNPSFDTGLAHALLPSAPAGLVRGVTRPAGPRSGPGGGGPLLLRALRQPDEAEAAPAPGTSPTAGAPQISRRVRPGTPPSRPGGSATSGPATAGPDPVVTRSTARGGASTHSAPVRGTPGPAVQRAGATASPAAPDSTSGATPSRPGSPVARGRAADPVVSDRARPCRTPRRRCMAAHRGRSSPVAVPPRAPQPPSARRLPPYSGPGPRAAAPQ